MSSSLRAEGAELPASSRRAGFRALAGQDWKRRLTRLNHVLIPDKKPERDALRSKPWVQVLGLGFHVFRGLSREGRGVLLLLVPVSLASLDIRYGQVYLLLALLSSLLVASFLCRPLFAIGATRIVVRCAPRVSVGEALHFEVQLNNGAPEPLFNLRLNLPFLPWDGAWKSRPVGVGKIAAGASASVSARAVFSARGEHHLDPFEAAALVPLGLCIGPKVRGTGSRFLVVPRVVPVTRVEWTREANDTRVSALSSRSSEEELAFLRPYRVGDALKHLHVKTWARTGVPHVRQHVSEGQRRATLSVLTAGFGASERVQEGALSLAAGIASRLALHQGGLDTLICDAARYRVEPSTGVAALDRVLDRLAVVESPAPAHFDPNGWQLPDRKCAGWVIVSAGEHVRLGSLVQQARASGIACTWVCVREGGDIAKPTRVPRSIDVAAIEQGRAVAL